MNRGLCEARWDRITVGLLYNARTGEDDPAVWPYQRHVGSCRCVLVDEHEGTHKCHCDGGAWYGF